MPRATKSGTGRRTKTKANGAEQLEGIPGPEEVLGYPMGAERRLPDWPEIVDYFQRLAAASDRVTVEELGQSTSGNPFIVVAISAAENLTPAARERNRQLLGWLADPRTTDAADTAEAIAQAKTVAVILATQHSNEIGAALMTLELAHDLATGNDPETQEILANTIILLVPSANPDGIRLIVEWYRRWLGTEYEGSELPWLYHPYVGHDNNRDWFMLTQRENQLYAALHNREHPQLVFDMHQMYRDGARFMVPPFIDPLDPNQDPVIQQGFADLGTAIAARLTAAGKAGVATHIHFDNYSPSLAYGNYHGSIDLLSEAASCRLATPVEIKEKELKVSDEFDPKARTWNHPFPWKGGRWTLREIVEYNKLAARAFLAHAAKYRERLLRDYLGIMRRAVERTEPPHAFIVPTAQTDPVTAVEMLQVLERGAVEIEEATAPFTADGVDYPAGTRLVRLDQPFSAFAKTLLEVQHYPDLRQWPGGPPQPPYDIAGHTLPIQMGVRVISVKEKIAPETRRLTTIAPPRGEVRGEGTYGFAFAPALNQATRAVQRLLAAEVSVQRAQVSLPELQLPAGSVLVPEPRARDQLVTIAAETGVDVIGIDAPLAVATYRQEPVRLGVYQSWKPAIDEGWARWVLEQYEIPYQTLHNAEIRQGDLADRFDVIVLPDQPGKDLLEGQPEKNQFDEPYPPEYVGGLGEVGMAALRAFVEAGGTVIGLEAVCEALIEHFALPVRNAVAGLPETDFYCPGSLLRVVVDRDHPLGYGLPREAVVLFQKSPAFEITPASEGTVIARYPQANPNLSGWILGPEHLAGKAAVIELPLGAGRVVLIGCSPHFRAQTRGSYKFLFNAIACSGLKPDRLELA